MTNVPDLSRSIRQELTAAARDWRKFEEDLSQLRTSLRDDHETAKIFVAETVQRRRLWRRFLRSRFGFDPVRRRWIRSAVFPTTSRALQWLTYSATMFAVTELVYRELGNPRSTTVPSAPELDAGLAVLRDLPTMAGLSMSVLPLAKQREASALSLASWVSTQVSVGQNVRLREALATSGQDPHTAFTDRLPGAVVQAWHEAQQSDSLTSADDLPRRVAHLLESDQSSNRHAEQLVLDDARRVRREIYSAVAIGQIGEAEAAEQLRVVDQFMESQLTALGDRQRRPELAAIGPDPLEEIAAREIVAEHIARARLSPPEAEVLGLHLGGMSNADIAEHLQIAPATVRGHFRNARLKLQGAHEA